MTYPTLLSPWFVVIRYRIETDPPERTDEGLYHAPEYWSTDGEGPRAWTRNPKQAMVFMSLHTASRIAATDDDSAVVAIYDKETYWKYRPREFSDER